jgi:ankyrin repeat protein
MKGFTLCAFILLLIVLSKEIYSMEDFFSSMAKGCSVQSLNEEEVKQNLHEATKNNNLVLVEKLIRSGFYIDSKDENGWTPLYCAVLNGNAEMVTLLIRLGANLHSENGVCRWCPLHCAAHNGNETIIKILVSYGAQINRSGGWGQCSPLHNAVQKKHHDTVALLVKLGADVNDTDASLLTPLHNAIMYALPQDETPPLEDNDQDLKMVKLLVGLGADLQRKNFCGETPYDCANHMHLSTIVNFLLLISLERQAEKIGNIRLGD